MNALRIYKTYPDYPNGKPEGVSAFYRWVCDKVKLENFGEMELSMPIYRGRKDIILAVNIVDDISELWTNINPFATELFKTRVAGECFIILENNDNFDLWCNIIKKDLKNLGCSDKSFTY